MSINGRILDVQDDPELELLKTAAGHGAVPADVLTMSADAISTGLDKLADAAFALVYTDGDEKIRKYASSTADQTWISGLYFLKHGHHLDAATQIKVASRLVSSCQLFELEPSETLLDVAAGKRTLEPKYASAYGELTEDDFALIRDGHPMYPLVTLDHVKQAIDYFNENCRFFEPADRREFCLKVAAKLAGFTGALEANAPKGVIQQMLSPKGEQAAAKAVAKPSIKPPATPAAAKKGAEMPKIMQDYAGKDVSPKLGAAIHDRFIHLGIEDDISKTTLLQIWDNRGSLAPEKIAQLLEAFDRQSGLSNLWDRKIPDPYVSVFCKQADDGDQAIYDEGGLLVTKTMVQKLGSRTEELTRHFDPGFAREFSLDPVTVFQSLPAPDKRVLAEMAVGSSQDVESRTWSGGLSAGQAQ